MSPIALISVSDKTGIVELARPLIEQYGFQILSSGGTAKTLAAAGIPVTLVSEHTGAPEILGGRVKTLHPRVHGGILARLDQAEDQADLEAQQIPAIQVVVVNLYPFEATVALPDTTLAEAIEKIDIGGPTLVRAAAKNYAHVTVLTDPSQYPLYLDQLAQHGESSVAFRWSCAQQAFSRILDYDHAIAQYFNTQSEPDGITDGSFYLRGIAHQPLRYGENPHQTATWYRDLQLTGWHQATKLQGKELSYNNLVDLEAARAIAAEFLADQSAAAVVIKHTNPCGVALGDTIREAYERALTADPVSAFGGIVALTRPLDVDVARMLTETFLECVVAPELDRAAAEVLQAKKNVRVLVLPDLAQGPVHAVRAIAGGFLTQQPDQGVMDPSQWQSATQAHPTEDDLAELAFAWRVCKHVKSNAIVITQGRQTLGIGAGQMNRVGSVEIALAQAGERVKGAVLASDGFFPFGDSVTLMAKAGIRAVIQPGGSLRDQESIDAANAAGIPMVMTGIRHFLH